MVSWRSLFFFGKLQLLTVSCWPLFLFVDWELHLLIVSCWEVATV